MSDPVEARTARPSVAAEGECCARRGRGRRIAKAIALAAMTAMAVATIWWKPYGVKGAGVKPAAGAGRIEIVSEDATSRVVRHAAGVSRIPREPQRICSLGFADELVALGLRPAAVATGTGWSLCEDYLGEPFAKAVQLPYGNYRDQGPCYEAIAACRPDLIVAYVRDLHTYEQLSAIAPTLVLRDFGTFCKENGDLAAVKARLTDLGRALGREKQAQAYIAAFDAQLARTREAVGPRMKGKRFAFIMTRFRRWLMFGRRDPSGMGAAAIYDALGLEAPAKAAGKGFDLDEEKLVDFDADYIILAADDTIGAQQTAERLARSELWRRVTAVREGHVLTLTAYKHWAVSGLIGKSRMLADLERCVRLGENDDARR